MISLRPTGPGGHPARPARGTLLAWAACAALAGCAATPAEVAAPFAAPSAYRGAASTDAIRPATATATATAPAAWWQAFNDPALNDLVERADRANTDIAQAAARLAQARAGQQAGRAARQPQLTAQAGLSRQGGPLVNAAGDSGTLVTALVGFSAELDLSGRAARGEQAVARDTASREALWQAVRLQVQAEVALAVLELRAVEAQSVLLDQELQAASASLRVAEARQELGAVAEREVQRQRTTWAETAAAAPSLARRRDLLHHALATLVGEPASTFQPPAGLAVSAAAPSDLLLPGIAAGLPSQMLQRRADVQAAAHALAAAQARVGVAQAAWFPSLQLTASGGQASPDLRSLLQGSMAVWGVGALLALPLLDGGRREAGIAQAQAEVQAAEAAWRGQVLQAFREVEDQLSRLGELNARQALQQTAEASVRRVADLTASRRRSGLASELEWWQARAEQLRCEQRGWQLRAEQAQATVGLVRALGGGWQVADQAVALAR